MTAQAPAAPLVGPAGLGCAEVRARRLIAIAAALSAMAVWILMRPYGGIWHDAGLYMGSVAAALDPDGLGRDLAFRDDGQFGMTVFPALAEALVRRLGLGPAALLLSGAGLVLWFTAMTLLLRRIATGPRLWVMLVCVAVLPAAYSAAGALRFGEALATPRVFAEAGVLAALAAFIGGRRWLAVALLAAAGAFHPIMALTGGAVVYLGLCAEDRRWLALGVVGLLAGAAGAALGLPVLERLPRTFDPAWREALNTWLVLVEFSEWTSQDWTRAAVQAGGLLIGASLLQGRARMVLLCVCLAGAAGPLLIEGMGSVLLTQLQLWRVLWLPAALGAAMTGYAALELRQRGALGRLTLAALALAWAGVWSPAIAGPALAAALASHVLMLRGRSFAVPERLPLFIAIGAVVAHLLLLGVVTLAGLSQGWGFDLRPAAYLGLDLHGVPLAAAAVALALRFGGRPPAPRRAAILAIAALTAVLAAAALWDDRRAGSAPIERDRGGPELRAMLASRPGEVLWVGGKTQTWFETWFVARRPAYWSVYQGAPRVFSRPLALEWVRRGDRLVALGVVGPYGRDGRPKPKAWDVVIRAEPLRRLCTSSDAPVWILAAPNRLGTGVPTAGVWRHSPRRAYALIPCRDPASPQRP